MAAAMTSRTKKAGFTLVELLLVLVLMGVAVGISMPYFVHSIRGNRLRTAGRTLVTVARYARSMAVLKQSEVSLVFNLDSGQIDVVSSNAALPGFARAIDGVQIEWVEVRNLDRVSEGTCAVPFHRNGVCRPFAVRVTDPHGAGLTVKVDALAAVRVIPD